ncbi:MAG: hypothetical protein ABIP51_18160 [Bacteroidia bacterium]
MEKFYVKYKNDDGIEGIYFVREEKEFPYHYLISDGKSHIDGGNY